MKEGSTCVFFFDRIVPNFLGEYFDPKTTPEQIFKPSAFDEEDVYKAMLKEEENVDWDGNKGCFEKDSGFCTCVLSTADPTAELIQTQLSERVPLDDFMFYRILESTD